MAIIRQYIGLKIESLQNPNITNHYCHPGATRSRFLQGLCPETYGARCAVGFSLPKNHIAYTLL